MRQSAAPVSMPAVQVAAHDWRTLDEPDQRHRWDALALCAAEPNPFFESWYLLPSLRALDTDNRVTLLCFEHDGDLAGLLPVRRESNYYGWPVPQLRGWVHGNCFLGAPLVATGLELRFWRAILQWADRNAGTSLFLHVPLLSLDGPLHDALMQVAQEQDRPAAAVHHEERALLSSSLAPDAYLEQALSGKKRKELRRQYARLAEAGELRFERRRDDQQLMRWIEDFLALEHAGWKGAAGSALASHQATAQMFREALFGAATHNKLERLSLILDDEPIAMLVNFLTPPGAYSYKTAFDERFARFSPGVLLQRENLDLLNHPAVQWCDSCAAADHPMIDHLWSERRPIGRISIGIGGRLRRAAFRALLAAELRGKPAR